MRKIITFIIFLMLSTNVFGCATKSIDSSANTTMDKNIDDTIDVDMDNNATYENKELNISLSYNKNWKTNSKYYNRYDGEDGYFQVSSLSGGTLKIDEIVDNDTNQDLKPYGTHPEITKLTIQGQDARLVLPSSDQPKENNNLAEVIIHYPENITIDGTTYNYIVLNADKNNIEKIAKSIKFIS